MNPSAVLSYVTARRWAMDPQHLRATADRLAIALGSASPEAIQAAQEAAAKKAAGGSSDPGYVVTDDGVAHIAIAGVILKEVPCLFELFGVPATSTLATQRALEAALYDERVKSIVMDIDSPGGSMDGLVELAGDIAAARDLKPTTAHVSGMAASAAYWLASQTSRVAATEGSLVGSIGVYSVIEDTSAAHAAAGIKVNVVRSHPLKGAGVDGDQVTPAQIQDAQRIVDEAAGMFVNAVAAGRGMSAEAVRELATGQVWFAGPALERRLIDEIASTKPKAAPGRAAAGPVAEDSGTSAPSAGATEEDMDPKSTTTGHPGATADGERIAKLEADLATANAKAAALEANTKALGAREKDALLEKYKDRIAPAALDGFKSAAATMNLEALESWLKNLPVVTRAARASVDLPADPKPAPAIDAGTAQVARWLETDAETMAKKIEAYDDVVGKFSDGRVQLKSGKVVSIEAFRKLKGLAGLAAALFIMLAAGIAHGAPLGAARATESKNVTAQKAYLMKASTTIYSGGLVMIDTNGVALPAAASASNHNIVGVATTTKTSAASGSYWITVAEGWFKFDADTIAQGNVGQLVYAQDDHTFDETPSANEPIAGVLIEYISASSGWIAVGPVWTVRDAVTSDPLTLTGDLTCSGGAGALTFTDTNSSIVLPDNDTTALLIGSTGKLNLMTFDTGDGTETVDINGTATQTAFSVTTGTASFAEAVTLAAGAGALKFTNTAASVTLNDNDASALDIGATGATSIMRFDTTDGSEGVGVTGYLKSTAGLITPGLEADLNAGACTAGQWKVDTGGAARELCRCNDAGTAYDCVTVTTANGPTN